MHKGCENRSGPSVVRFVPFSFVLAPEAPMVRKQTIRAMSVFSERGSGLSTSALPRVMTKQQDTDLGRVSRKPPKLCAVKRYVKI